VTDEYKNYASHFAEVPLVFGEKIYVFEFNETLSNTMESLWSSFADGDRPPRDRWTNMEWPEWGSTSLHVYFGEEVKVTGGYEDAACGFWESYGRDKQKYGEMLNWCFQKVVA
jgi:hypothetical protein